MIRKPMRGPSSLDGCDGNPHSGRHWSSYDCAAYPQCTPYFDTGEAITEEETPTVANCTCTWKSTHTDECGAVPPRESALREAANLITGDRNNQYGPPTQDFQRTADLLNALGYRRVEHAGTDDAEVKDITMSDVALIQMQVKMSRLMHSRNKRDHYVDLAGYAGCAWECATEEFGDGAY